MDDLSIEPPQGTPVGSDPEPPSHPRTLGWLGTAALAMGGSNQSLFILGALILAQGSAAIPLLAVGLLLSWAAAPGWVELVLMWPKRVGGIAGTCAEAFRPYSPVLANLTGVAYWWGWVPTCGLTAILSASALHQWYLPHVPVHLMASGLVLIFTGVNLLGVRWATRLAIPIAFASALLALLSGLIPVLAGQVDWHRAASFHLSSPFGGFFGGLTSAMAGLYLIGFAAPAFEAATCHVGETRDPARNVKRAVFASGGMASIYFVALPVIWLGMLGAKPLGGHLTQALGPTFAPLLGSAGKAAAIWFMTFNMFHGTLQPLAGASRTLLQLAEDGLLPRSLGSRSRRDVPWVATLLTAGVSILFLQSGDPTWVIAAANLCYLIGIGMPSIAVWLLRRNEPDRHRPYRAPRGMIAAGVVSAGVWLLSTVLGFEQFGLPTVVASIGLAYAGSALYLWRVISDRRQAGLPSFGSSLHAKLTGAMIAVMMLDAVGYLLAIQHVHADPSLKTVLEDIFVVVAILTISVGLILPGIISHAVEQVAAASNRLAQGTLADLTRAMRALARGDLQAARARKEFVELRVRSRDELGRMAETFNQMQREVARAADALDGARGGLAAAEERLELYAAEQADWARSEQHARLALERANNAKSEFLSRVSHELRTPLNAILGFGQLLELDDLGPDQRESVAHILAGGRHLIELIDELLDVSRIETGKMEFSLEPVDVIACLESVVALCRPLAAEHKIDISVELVDVPIWAEADVQRLKQVMFNLLSNAVKYNRPRGAVRCRVATAGEHRVSIAVSDTGQGMTAGQLEHLFVPFERLEAARTDIPGTGLGLVLSKTLVEAMRGELSVQSTRGAGTTFTVTLVVAEEPVEDADDIGGTPGVRGAAETPTPGRQPRGKVMYVEDNPANLRVVERVIAAHSNASFVAVTRGNEAIRAVREHEPDLVLLDLHLPDVHGSDVLTALRADQATREIPVIVLSADATSHQIAHLKSLGAKGYLTKPIEVPRLLEQIHLHVTGVTQ